jgi:hypothetical protein
MILSGARGDAKFNGVIASVMGSAEPGGNLTADQRSLAPETSRDAAPQNAWERLKDSKGAGCGSPADLTRGRMERYAQRQRNSRAEAAAESSVRRADIQARRTAAQEADAAACDALVAAAQARRLDPALSERAAGQERERLVREARAQCDRVAAATTQRFEQELAAVTTADADAERRATEGNAEIQRAYDEGIAAAAVALQRDYTTAGNARRRRLSERTRFDEEFLRKSTIDEFFATVVSAEGWTARCRSDLGFREGASVGGYRDPTPDNVDRHCKVQDGLVRAVEATRGTIDAPAGE